MGGVSLVPRSLPDPSPTSALSGIVVNALNSNPNLAAAILLSLRRSLAETRSMDVQADQTFLETLESVIKCLGD